MIELTLDGKVNGLEAVQSAIYRTSDVLNGKVSTSGDNIHVEVTSNEDSKASDTEAVELFQIALNDENLRQKVAERTSQIRTLILAHAFSNVKFDDSE